MRASTISLFTFVHFIASGCFIFRLPNLSMRPTCVALLFALTSRESYSFSTDMTSVIVKHTTQNQLLISNNHRQISNKIRFHRRCHMQTCPLLNRASSRLFASTDDDNNEEKQKSKLSSDASSSSSQSETMKDDEKKIVKTSQEDDKETNQVPPAVQKFTSGAYMLYNYTLIFLGVALTLGLVLNLCGYGYIVTREDGLRIDTIERLRTENQFNRVALEYEKEYSSSSRPTTSNR